MKTENLKQGMIIKSYKELCKLLEEKPKTSNSKKAQMKVFDSLFGYHKNGNKFIIDEVYQEQKEIIGTVKSNGAKEKDYIKELEVLIMSMVANSDGKVYIPINRLLNRLGVVNSNYIEFKDYPTKLVPYVEMSDAQIEHFYEINHSMFKRDVEKALDNLEMKCLVIWGKQTMVVETLSNGIINHRAATEEEDVNILKIKRNLLKEMNCNSVRDVIIRNQIKYFYKALNRRISKELGLYGSYQAYKILFNSEHILKELYNYKIQQKLLLELVQSVNKAVMKRIGINSANRYKRAIHKKDISKTLKEKDKMITNENYLKNNNELIDILINLNTEYLINNEKFDNYDNEIINDEKLL